MTVKSCTVRGNCRDGGCGAPGVPQAVSIASVITAVSEVYRNFMKAIQSNKSGREKAM
jgi:hypothetical protein